VGNDKDEQCLYPGKDYANERRVAFTRLEFPLESCLEREKAPRMPFHDTAVCIEGESASDLAHHFV